MFQQDPRAVADSLALSALCALIPLAVLFVLLGGLKVRAWIAGLVSLLVALVVAVVLFGMPVGQAISAADRRRAVRLLPDPVDRHQRGLDLQPDRGVAGTSTCCGAPSRR